MNYIWKSYAEQGSERKKFTFFFSMIFVHILTYVFICCLSEFRASFPRRIRFIRRRQQYFITINLYDKSIIFAFLVIEFNFFMWLKNLTD